ncbi:MAG: FHA domain-containing protein [Acidimicrobiales bacterium]
MSCILRSVAPGPKRSLPRDVSRYCNRCGQVAENHECDDRGGAVDASSSRTGPVPRISGAEDSLSVYRTEEVVQGLHLEAGQSTIVVTRGPNLGARVPLGAGVVALGRDGSATLLLNHVSVSRRHAAIRPHEGGYIVEDLRSLNGTYVNGVRIDKVRLAHGDQIQIGMFKLAFLASSAQGPP